MKKLLLLSLLFVPCLNWSGTPKNSPVQQADLQESIQRGKDVYTAYCISCHQANGEGIPGVYPPLAKSDHLSKDQLHAMGVLLMGQNEEIKVNGSKYNMPMASVNYLTDQQIADVLNYMGNSWENRFSTVTPAQVKAKRN